MAQIPQPSNTDALNKVAVDKPVTAINEQRKLRPRRPIAVNIDNLPDDALVAKDIRRAVTGLGDSQTYALIQQGRFPPPLKLGPRCSRWRMGSLRRWLVDPLGYHCS